MDMLEKEPRYKTVSVFLFVLCDVAGLELKEDHV